MRFDKLEFESPENRPSNPPSTPSRAEKDEQHWMRLADESRRTGNYENALRFYSRSLEENKTLVAAWVGQVQMLVQLHEYPQAGLWSQKALELFPSQGDLMAGQAQAECRMGNLKKAYALSDGALRQRGETSYRWQVRGEIMVSGKDRTDRHCFDKAQVADGDWLVPLESAMIYNFYRVYSKAQQRAQIAVEKAPDSYHAWYVLGLTQANSGFSSPATNSFRRCLELCPRHAEAMAKLAEVERGGWPFGRIVGRLFGR